MYIFWGPVRPYVNWLSFEPPYAANLHHKLSPPTDGKNNAMNIEIAAGAYL